MRVSVDLADDVYKAARSFAGENSIALGDALTELVRRGLQQRAVAAEEPFPTFVVPLDAEPITLEQTLRAEDGD